MKRVLRILALFIVIAGSPASASEELTPEKKADIRTIFSMTGVLEMANVFAKATSHQIISAVQSARPDISSTLFEVIREETRNAIDEAISEQGGLIDLLVPIYHRNFTHDEIKGLLSFYRTPLGQKLIAAMPVMMQESMAAGQQWVKQFTPILKERIRDRLRKKGIEI